MDLSNLKMEKLGELVEKLERTNHENSKELLLLLKEMQEWDANSDFEQPPNPNPPSKFKSWIDNNSGRLYINPSLIIKQDQFGGYGIFSSLDLPIATELVKIPLEFLICEKDSFSLVARLISEDLDEKSFWRPYLDFLPRSFPTIPLFWSAQKLEWSLKGSSCFSIDSLINSRFGYE